MNRFFANSAPAKIPQSTLRSAAICGLAVVLTAAMYLLRLSLPVAWGERPMLILFMLPILVTALLGGFRPGLFATALAAACTAWLIPPTPLFAMAGGPDLLQWGVLVVNGLLVSSISGLLHRSRRRESEKWQQLVATENQLRERESQFQSTFEEAAVGMALVGLDGRWLRVNRKLCAYVGYSAEELYRLTFQDLTHPDDLQEDLRQVQRLLGGEIQTYEIEKRYFHQQGEVVWVNLSVSLIRKPDGIPDHFVSVVEDIRHRKNAEAALSASEQSYRSLFENMINGYSHCLMLYEDGQPADFIYLHANKAFELMTGLKDVVGRKVSELLPGILTTNPDMFAIKGRVALGGAPERFEIHVGLLNKWFRVSVFSPKTEEFVAIIDDITESKTAELLVRQSEEMQRAILDSVNSHIAVLDSQGTILAVNRPWVLFAEENGFYPQTINNNYHVGENYLDVCQRSTGDASEGALMAVNGIKDVLSGRIVNFTMEYPCHSPMQQRWFSMTVTPLGEVSPGEAQPGVVVAHQNITARKLAENAVNLLSDDLSATLQAIPDELFEIDEAGLYINIRTTQKNLLAAPPENLVGSTVQQMLPADAAQTVLQAMAAAKLAGSDYGRTILLPLPQGERCFELSVARKAHNNGQLPHFIVLAHDITQRIATEAALRQQTQELAERNAELQRFNQAMVGRELSMIELKKEANALSQQLGLKPPYSLDFLETVPQAPQSTSPP